MSGQLPVLIDACWSVIGVRGDRTCPRLREEIHCHNCNVFADAAKQLLDRPVSTDYLSELTRFVSEPAEARKLANRSVVAFELGSERYAVLAHDVLEVAEVLPPRRVPHRTNGVFLGMVSIQGRLELCLSLAGILGPLPPAIGISASAHEPPSTAMPTRVLVVVQAAQRWVFVIDKLEGVHRFNDSSLLEVPATSKRQERDYVSALLPHDGRLYGVLNVARICQDAEAHLR